MVTVPTLHRFDGSLGGFEEALSRRRIAVAADDRGRPFLLRPDSLVLHYGDDDEYGAVDAAIRDAGLQVLGGDGRPRPTHGAVAARFGTERRPTSAPARWPTEPLLELYDELSDKVPSIALNHVYLADGVTQHFGVVDDARSAGTPGQAAGAAAAQVSSARPAPPPRRLRTRLAIPGRRRPNVLVLDTGLRTRDARVEHPDLTNCVLHSPWLDGGRAGRWDDEDQPDDDRLGRLDVQAGHGTFISGIVRQWCPDALVHHTGTLTSYGDGDDASIFRAIERSTLRLGDDIDVVVMAFGTYCMNDLPSSMATAVARLGRHAVVVASAGNDGTVRPYYPAAMPGVVGVGALDQARRAAFSNFGPWVDACASGVDVVSTFFTDFDDSAPGRGLVNRYRGWASWSGTSFAAPRVAAAIAQEMYLRDVDAHHAWDAISREATFRRPDLGIVVDR